MELRSYRETDLPAMGEIWNGIVRDGNAFPGEQELSLEELRRFFAEQTRTVCACVDGQVAGLYILHPNNIGRCGHIANASYGVSPRFRRQGVGEALVRHSLQMSRECGFQGLQFNAVVSTNRTAIALYRKLGFSEIGTIPGGFRLQDGRFVDIHIFYHAV